MKICVITLSNSEIISSKTSETLNQISSQLYKNGQEVIFKQILKSKSSALIKSLILAFEECNCVVLVCENESERFYMCKNVLCELFDTKLVNSEYAKKNIDEAIKNQNIPLKKEELNCQQMPQKARTIKNPFSAYQGCLIEEDDKMLFLLPLEHNELYHIFYSSVLPYILQSDSSPCGKTFILKTFGLKYNEMITSLREFINNKLGVEVICSEYLLSGEVIIRVPKGVRNDYSQNLIQSIYQKIMPFVYSDKDESEEEFISSLMTLRKMRLAVAEDFTAGMMAFSLYEKLSNASDILKEGYFVPTNEAKMKLLGVEEEVLNKDKLDYDEIAYQMALGTLENSGADVVVANCGDREKGQVHFAIGNADGIHIYNQKVTGSYEQKMTTATNAIFFQLIKKLKQNDFHLGKTTV